MWWLVEVGGGPEMEAGTAYLNHHRSIESSSFHLPPKGCLGEADVHVRVDIKTIPQEQVTVLHLREERAANRRNHTTDIVRRLPLTCSKM